MHSTLDLLIAEIMEDLYNFLYFYKALMHTQPSIIMYMSYNTEFCVSKSHRTVIITVLPYTVGHSKNHKMVSQASIEKCPS